MTDIPTTETRDELRNRVLRLLGESSMRRNQIARADSYLAGIERERARLKGGSHSPVGRIQEDHELDRLDREEGGTRDSRAVNVLRADECDRERAELEEKLNAQPPA